jgi:hexosaminidase
MLNLLPIPRTVSPSAGTFSLRDQGAIVLAGAEPAELRPAADRLHAALKKTGWTWTIGQAAGPAMTLQLEAGAGAPPQGYALSFLPDGLTVRAADPAGLFYGVCTLIQIIEQSAPELPALQITDWPDFAARGVMLDISRDRVWTMSTLYGLVDLLAGWKVNQLQLYTEHTFAYTQHPEVWAFASPMTAEEIRELDAYCRARFVELVPNQNSFGHMHRWLTHARYAPLAETHDWFETPWGMRMQGPFSLAPVDPGSLDLVRGLYDELLPNFSSRQFNVGCDETIDLGQGRSRAAVAAAAPGRVYLDFLLEIYRAVTERGRTMQFWGDIIIHHPELIAELPKDVVALEWGYEANHPFDAHAAEFSASGLSFYVCPGTSSWNSIAGRTANALGNLAAAAEAGLLHGATGYLNTDWGDNGHWQTLPMSYVGFAAGAAYSWAYAANCKLDVARAVSVHALGDPSGSLGQAAYDLGNVYRAVGYEPHNASALFWTLQRPLADVARWAAETAGGQVTAAGYERAWAAADAALKVAARGQSTRADEALLRRELELAGHMLGHAARRGQLALGAPVSGKDVLADDLAEIATEYRSLWRVRSRPGGLRDSVARLDKAAEDYA